MIIFVTFFFLLLIAFIFYLYGLKKLKLPKNIFYIPDPVLMPIFKLFKAGWKQYKEEIHFGDDHTWIHEHGNIHRKDQQLSYHDNRYPILGYVGI